MTGPDTAESFVAGWQRHWPEWSIAEAFMPSPQRPVARAWLALTWTLSEAAWAGSDPAPGLAKLAWWHEELEGWGRGARRHPLGAVLQRLPAPWPSLARTLNALPGTRGERPELAMEGLAALAAAIVACESALFAPAAEAGGAPARPGFSLLAERTLLTASHDDAAWLLARRPSPAAGALPRRLHCALLRLRLEALADRRPVAPAPGWRVLAASWRASRGR